MAGAGKHPEAAEYCTGSAMVVERPEAVHSWRARPAQGARSRHSACRYLHIEAVLALMRALDHWCAAFALGRPLTGGTFISGRLPRPSTCWRWHRAGTSRIWRIADHPRDVNLGYQFREGACHV